MEYPNTRFTHKMRVIMLALFIAAFFVIAPVIIMYTAGYRYDWRHGLLKETGAISVDVEPKHAVVYLNGIRLKDKMPIRLNNIAPAKYNLRVSAPEYFDWAKEIEVKNKQTNYTKEISLIKKTKPQILISGKMDNLAVSYDGKFIIYGMKKNNATELWLWDNAKAQAAFLSRFSGAEPVKIVWAEKNNYAVIADAEPPYARLLVVNAANPQKQTDLAAGRAQIKKFVWGLSAEPQLYYSADENIFLYSPITAKSQLVTQNHYLDWYMENGQLWTLQTDTSTKQYNIVRDTLGFNSVFNRLDDGDLSADATERAAPRILAARQNTVLLSGGSEQMILLNQNNKYKITADKFLVSRYNNWWLFWSQWELWTYSEGEEPNLLNRSGEHLRKVMPLDKYNTLALVWANKTSVLFPYYLVAHELLNGNMADTAIDAENKIFYFINQTKDEEGIWKLNY